MSIASLYIPHVFINIDERRIIDVLDSLGLCEVSKVDFVQKIGTKGVYNSVYIHINHWYDNVVADNFQERVLNPDKEARIVYEDPWYWIALENKGHKFVSGQRKPRIDLGSINQNHAYAMNKSCDQINRSFAYDETDYKETYELTESQQLEESMLDEIEAMMDEEEAFIQKNNQHLIRIDGRYVTSIEQMTTDLQKSLHKSRDEMMHWFAETGELQHENNLMADEISCLKAQLSLLQEKDSDEDSYNDCKNWYSSPDEEHEHYGQGVRVGPATYS